MRISDWSSDVCSSDLHYAAPSNQTDDGKHDSAAISSREAILEEIGTHFHGTLYRKGSVTLTIQNLVAERDYVAGRFILEARTLRHDRPYKNYYHFLYRCEQGRVVVQTAEEHTSELQSLIRKSYAFSCLKINRSANLTRAAA